MSSSVPQPVRDRASRRRDKGVVFRGESSGRLAQPWRIRSGKGEKGRQEFKAGSDPVLLFLPWYSDCCDPHSGSGIRGYLVRETCWGPRREGG